MYNEDEPILVTWRLERFTVISLNIHNSEKLVSIIAETKQRTSYTFTAKTVVCNYMEIK